MVSLTDESTVNSTTASTPTTVQHRPYNIHCTPHDPRYTINCTLHGKFNGTNLANLAKRQTVPGFDYLSRKSSLMD